MCNAPGLFRSWDFTHVVKHRWPLYPKSHPSAWLSDACLSTAVSSQRPLCLELFLFCWFAQLVKLNVK